MRKNMSGLKNLCEPPLPPEPMVSREMGMSVLQLQGTGFGQLGVVGSFLEPPDKDPALTDDTLIPVLSYS